MRKGAQQIEVAFTAIPERSLFPQRDGVMLIVHDITARKSLEHEVRKRVKRLESMEHLARVGSWELDVSTGTLEWSGEFREMLGLAPSLRKSTLRRHLLRIRPEDRKRFVEGIRRTVKEHIPFESHHGLRREDGSFLEVLSRGRLISGPRHHLRVVGISQDLRDTAEGLVPVLGTHLQRLKGLQRHSLLLSRAALVLFSSFDYKEALLRTVKAIVPGLADRCTIDIIEKKQLVLRFRASRMGAVGKDLPAWVDRTKLSRFPRGPQARVLRTGTYELHESVSAQELRSFIPDLSALALKPGVLPTSLLLLPLHSRRGPMGVITLLHSESKRRFGTSDLLTAQRLALLASLAIERGRLHENVLRRMEEARRNSRELAELNRTLESRVKQRTLELEESLGNMEGFAGTLVHDLRAPLRGISGLAEALVEEVGDLPESDARTLASRIRDCCGRMDALIADVLTYSRAARLEITIEPLELDAIVQTAKDTLADDIGRRRARIHIPDRLPQVMGHRGLLVQAVANLLDNALKFVAPGTTPSIRINAERQGDRVRLEIQDNGIGIPPEHADRVFKAFERLNPGNSFSGTGLGLTIVRNSIERMGGSVGVKPGTAGGSLFTIELPGAADPNPSSPRRS